ncbi:MAG: hypothetical protein HDS46_03865 [Bacteroides sp.]|nr:hypothetical protein [Bacteroides sp.]
MDWVKKHKSVVIGSGIVVIAFAIIFYFFIPTTDYYKISITPNSIDSLYGAYESPDIDITEVSNEGSWEETYQTQSYITRMSRDRTRRELNDYVSSSSLDGKRMALEDISRKVSILVSIKHTRIFDAKKVLREIGESPNMRTLERLQGKYRIEIKADIL